MEESISTIFDKTCRQFRRLISSERLQALKEEVWYDRWTDELGRLQVWASNVKLDRDSFEHRLRYAPHIKDQVIQLLSSLQGLFDDIDGVINRQWDDEFDGMTELQQLYQAVVETVTCLNQMTMAISRPPRFDPKERKQPRNDNEPCPSGRFRSSELAGPSEELLPAVYDDASSTPSERLSAGEMMQSRMSPLEIIHKRARDTEYPPVSPSTTSHRRYSFSESQDLQYLSPQYSSSRHPSSQYPASQHSSSGYSASQYTSMRHPPLYYSSQVNDDELAQAIISSRRNPYQATRYPMMEEEYPNDHNTRDCNSYSTTGTASASSYTGYSYSTADSASVPRSR